MDSNPKAPERLYLGKSRAARDAQRRRQLLDAALVVFCERGYARTRVNDICREAHVTTRSFYEHFDSLEALMLAVFNEVQEEAFTAVAAVLGEAQGDAVAFIRKAIDAHVRAMAASEHRLRFMFIVVVGATPALEAARRDAERLGRETLRLGFNALLNRGDPAIEGANDLTFAALTGAISQSLVTWIDDPNPPPLETLIDELVHVFCAVAFAPRNRGG